ncbi:hypothetical protein LNTAR_03059 [Lentisphaera araneosa HTCC2155]|uniref:Antitoxin n=1 Tax=Lentisphaera araneosa HTCC2155 TaxID=313628 RepID=A6DTU2_9BACT|nr:hypothetical protein [Lentisphaera araneosa]EDM24963.1 hypothetical protein LNTAR_03059 [Lentisphaera araneosa HTCC2155]
MNTDVQYITDKKGRKKSVILDIDQYERIMEDLSDLATAAERSQEDSIPMEVFLQDLKKDGII